MPPARRDHRPDQHRVHQLPVDDLLQRQQPEHAQRLPLEPEGDHRGDELDRLAPTTTRSASSPGRGRAARRSGRCRPAARAAAAAPGTPRGAPARPGRSDPTGRSRAPRGGASTSTASSRSSSGSAGARAGRGSRAPRSRPAPTPRRPRASRSRQIAIVRSVSSASVSSLTPPTCSSTERRNAPTAPGDGGHAAQDVVDAAVDVEAHDVLDVLPARDQRRGGWPTLALPATAPTDGSANGWTSRPTVVGLEHRVAVDHDDQLVPGVGDAGVERGGLARRWPAG